MPTWKDETVNEGAIDEPTVVRKQWTDDLGDGVAFTKDTPKVHGRVTRVATIPDLVNIPDEYDLALLDSDGIDILAGQGAGRSGSAVGDILFANPPSVLGALTISITGQAVAGAKGIVAIYLEDEQR